MLYIDTITIDVYKFLLIQITRENTTENKIANNTYDLKVHRKLLQLAKICPLHSGLQDSFLDDTLKKVFCSCEHI